ncbi:MAG TPA: sensor domain-containing diguanylate cyclase [Longimicrobium sp.]|nr:sensor domain-containing diguanylate cyclase [Longimicrobium sp.]
MSRLDRLPLPLASFFYAAALGAVLLPYLAAAPPGERLIWGVYTLTVALYGALTLLVLHQRPGDPRGELFMFLGVAVSLTLLFDAAHVRVGAGWGANLLLLAYCGVYLVSPAVAFHMAASIPRPHPLTRRHPRLVRACYAACFCVAVAIYLALLNTEYAFLPWRATLPGVQRVLSGINWLSLLLSSWGGVALLSSAAQRADSPAERRQALIVYAGLLPYACNTALAIAAPGINASPVGQVVEAIVIALVPVSFAVAILGHRLFQVGVLVRRGLVFGLTTGVLAASGYLAAVALDEIASDVLGLSLTTWGAAALFLVVGVLWQPLARVVGATVDRRFFPERVALGELRRTIIPELAGYTELEAAAAHLTRRLRESLELETATLLMADAHGEWFRPLGWAGDFHGADPRQIALSAAEIARMNGGMMIAAPIGEDGADADPSAVAPLRAAYAVPIRLSLSDRLTGVLLLGRSVHRRALERDALEMLDAVALQASAMLENARLFALATRDPLTGLLRRHAAMDRLAEEVERCRRTFHPFAVALADLDHFKNVNDTRGHAAGDAALRTVADIFASYSRRTDLVARYGGEEFLFVLPDTPAAGARVHAEAVRAQVERILVRAGAGDEAPVRVTVSIGVYAVGAPGLLADPDELVRRADEALYRAKRAGRNRVEAGSPLSAGATDPAEAESTDQTETFDTVHSADCV